MFHLLVALSKQRPLVATAPFQHGTLGVQRRVVTLFDVLAQSQGFIRQQPRGPGECLASVAPEPLPSRTLLTTSP